jgi:hypothetical protein
MAEHKQQAHPQQDLAHQHPAQVLRQRQAGVLLQQHQAALVAVQDLEHQRLKLSQDLAERPPL